MTYLFNRNFSFDASGDLVLATSPPTTDNSNDVATTSYVQAVLAQSGYNANNVAITGGTINNTSIGQTTPSAGSFTTGSFSGTLTATNATINGSVTLTGALIEHTNVITAATNPVVVATNDVVIIIRRTTPAITTVTLPASPTTGRYLVIKDGAGNAPSFNITVNGNIDGGTSSVINTSYGNLAIIFNGSTWSIVT